MELTLGHLVSFHNPEKKVNDCLWLFHIPKSLQMKYPGRKIKDTPCETEIIIDHETELIQICDSSGKLIIEIPRIFPELRATIEKSLNILYLKQNWDEDGSNPINRQTYIKGINFLKNIFIDIWDNGRGIKMYAPKIQPTSDGNILFVWKNSEYKLLMLIYDKPINGVDGDLYGMDNEHYVADKKFTLGNKCDYEKVLWDLRNLIL